MTDSEAKSQMASGPRKPAFEPVPFGRHCLIDRISQGGMSDIYLARAEGVSGFQKPVVIKKLLPRYANKPRYVKRFLNEAKTLARLNHSNIVQILDMGIIGGEYYIALEYIEGRNVAYILSKAQRTGKPPALEFALHITMEVARGLAYAHRKKGPLGENLLLVHQDINSFNVMASYEAEVKIIDFGIARMFLENDGGDGFPVAGKLLYFSPEQLQKKPVDRRVDIYGVGVLLYELITGQRLVNHQETVGATVRAILELDVRQKVESNDRIPLELHTLLIRSMALDPEDRYPWIEDMIEDIRGVIRTLSLDINPSVFSEYMKEQFRREILLDRQRLRRLMSDEPGGKQAGRARSRTTQGTLGWKDVNLVTSVVEASMSEQPLLEGQENSASSSVKTMSFGSGKTIYKHGDPADEIFIIQKGRVRTFLQVGQRSQIVSRLKEGEIFGESCLIDEPFRTEYAEAELDCDLICLDREQFGRLIDSDIAGKTVFDLSRKLGDCRSMLENALFDDSLSRLIHALIFFCHRRSCVQNGEPVEIGELVGLFGIAETERIRRYLEKLESLEALKADEKNVQIANLEKLENLLSLLSRPGRLTLKL
jgi:serine/threonine protein kinase